MSLSRWSNSCWYIYEPCGSAYSLEICSFRQVSVVDIFRRFPEINKQAKDEGYSLLERLELKAYLKLWAFMKMKKLSFRIYVKLLNYLRDFGLMKIYVEDPWSDFMKLSGGIPKSFQIKPTLCNKSLAKAEAKRKARDLIKNSPLERALA